jgi:hypothetical protein
MIKEPDKIPVYHADEAASARVHVLLSIVANTRDLPKLKPLHDEAMLELEVLGEEGRVRLLKYNADVKARDVVIGRLRAEEAAKVRADEVAKMAEQQKAEGVARAEAIKRGPDDVRVRNEEEARAAASRTQADRLPSQTNAERQAEYDRRVTQGNPPLSSQPPQPTPYPRVYPADPTAAPNPPQATIDRRVE